jgi:uncharacterized protein (TIGR04255 family)
MRGHKTFPNAPIIEATATFAATFETPPTVEALGRYGPAVAHLFPNQQPREEFETAVRIEANAPIFQNTTHQFLAFSSADEKDVAQVRPSGFSFSRLKPYTRWSEFLDRTMNGWNLYRDTFNPSAVSRISLRYLNRIDLPNPFSAEEYFATRILLPRGVPHVVTNAIFSFSLSDVNNISDHATFFIDYRSATKDSVAVMFQVETRREVTISENTDDTIRLIMEQLRECKNKLFFRSLTKKTKEMFE